MAVIRDDVAKAAGVSSSTVSLILNGKTEHFNPKTIKLVKDAAKKLGYTPNKIAKALKTGKSNIVALWVTNITDMYNSAMIKNIQKELSLVGYDLIVKNVRKVKKITEEMYVDAIIAFDCADYMNKYLELTGSNIPMVSAGMYFSNLKDNVTFDISSGFSYGFNILINNGCKKIAYLGPAYSNKDPRYILYKEKIKKHGLEVFNIFLEDQSNDELVYKNLDDCAFLKDLDAIYSYNDFNAFRLMGYLHKKGINVPKDIKIISTDNVYMCDYYSPSLSSIEIPLKLVCKTIVEFIVNRVNNPSLPIQKKEFSSMFVERESSK